MKKILLFSQFFYPDKTGTGKILAELFLGLDKDKFSINVISGRKIYNDSEGKILSQFELVNSIKIYRTFKWELDKNKFFGRIYNYIMFFICACYKCFKLKLQLDKDIIISVSNPPIMPLLGAVLKNKRNKFIYIVHDLYPDIAIALKVVNKDSLLAKIMLYINKFVFSKADKIVVLGRDMENYINTNYKVSSSKLIVISNWSNYKNINTNKRSDSLFKVLYTGNIGRFHNLEIAVDAIKGKNDIEMKFVGEGALKNSLEQQAENFDNIKFSSYLDDEKYYKELDSADVLLVSLEKNLSGMAVPSKLYTYLSTGKPILCISDSNTEMAMIIKEYNCGFVINHNDIESFNNYLNLLKKSTELRNEMGKNGYKAYVENYKKEDIIKKYEDLFENL